MSTKKFNFLQNLHLLAGRDKLRPIMDHIYFHNDFAYVTNAHLMLKQHLSLHSVLDFENLNGKTLHWRTFQIIKQKFDIVKAKEDGVECSDNYGNKCFFEYSISDKAEFYNQMENVFPKGECVEVDNIGLNPALIHRLTKAMFLDSEGVKFNFYGKNKSVVIETEQKQQQGLLMPVMLNY